MYSVYSTASTLQTTLFSPPTPRDVSQRRPLQVTMCYAQYISSVEKKKKGIEEKEKEMEKYNVVIFALPFAVAVDKNRRS